MSLLLPKIFSRARCLNLLGGQSLTQSVRFLSIQPHLNNIVGKQNWKKTIEELDPVQAKFYHEEQLIKVDYNDNVIGPLSKGESHYMETVRNNVFHRALSLFVFNESGQFLLTQRSATKITFPGCFTNACCSHPLYNRQELEDDGNAIGVRRATIRRASFELGIDESEIRPQDLKLMNRFSYQAESEGSLWGEAEIDYVFVLHKNLHLRPNPDEVKDYKYVDREEMKSLLCNHGSIGVRLTPWLKLIASEYLFKYWNNLGHLEKIADHKTIVRFGGIMPASFTT